MSFTVDGTEWTIPCDITRKIRVADSDISGLLLTGQMFHDVLGTYYDYEVTLVPNPHDMEPYYSLLNVLSQPVDGHQFIFPFDGSTVEVTAKVDEMSDVYVRMPDNHVYWKGLKFTAASNGPNRTVSLSEAISNGLTPLPDNSGE